VSPLGVRGAFATADIPAGGLLASVPLRLTIRFPIPKTNEDLLVGVMAQRLNGKQGWRCKA
jgi:hypothetical protein